MGCFGFRSGLSVISNLEYNAIDLGEVTVILNRLSCFQEATELGKRAKEVREIALALQREERAGSKGRKWRKNVKQVQQVVGFSRIGLFYQHGLSLCIQLPMA